MAAVVADIIFGALVGPVKIEKRHSRGVHERGPRPEHGAGAYRACQFIALDNMLRRFRPLFHHCLLGEFACRHAR